MVVLQIIGIGLVAVLLLLVVREYRPEFASLLSIAVGVLILLLLIDKIDLLIDVMVDLGSKADINQHYITTILKILGIAYIAEFAAQISRDAKEGAIAQKIEMAGKIIILILAVPLIEALVDLILRMLP